MSVNAVGAVGMEWAVDFGEGKDNMDAKTSLDITLQATVVAQIRLF